MENTMKITTLASDLAASGAQTAQTMNTTPFLDDHAVVAMAAISTDFDGTIKIQGSDDGGTTYTDLVTVTGDGTNTIPTTFTEIELKATMRANMSAYTAGSATVQLLAS